MFRRNTPVSPTVVRTTAFGVIATIIFVAVLTIPSHKNNTATAAAPVPCNLVGRNQPVTDGHKHITNFYYIPGSATASFIWVHGNKAVELDYTQYINKVMLAMPSQYVNDLNPPDAVYELSGNCPLGRPHVRIYSADDLKLPMNPLRGVDVYYPGGHLKPYGPDAIR